LLEAASSAQEVSPKISNELLDRARNEVRAAVDEARLAVWNLRQSSGSGEDLVKAIAQLAQRTEQETGIPVKFDSSGTPFALGAASEWSLLMVTREALQNAIRHAAPQQLSVVLSFDRRDLRVEIEDDGCGFDASIIHSSNGRHYGLIGMRERVEKLGGVFGLTSSPGKGTQVHFSIPPGKPYRSKISNAACSISCQLVVVLAGKSLVEQLSLRQARSLSNISRNRRAYARQFIPKSDLAGTEHYLNLACLCPNARASFAQC
jgi:nitrate/nitrite-specific signal transduction histidine kinase